MSYFQLRCTYYQTNGLAVYAYHAITKDEPVKMCIFFAAPFEKCLLRVTRITEW